MAGSDFDPTTYLRLVRTGGRTVEHLDVRWRLVWLRTEHPDAQVTTTHVKLDGESVVVRANVAVPGGGAASGYGSARPGEAGAVEAAEMRALGRALALLGYGAAYAVDLVLPEETSGTATAQVGAAAQAEASSQASASASATGSVSSSVASEDSAPASAVRSAVPSAQVGTGTLPPGVTVGPGGSTRLPPKIAAAFAQAKPITDDDLTDPFDDLLDDADEPDAPADGPSAADGPSPGEARRPAPPVASPTGRTVTPAPIARDTAPLPDVGRGAVRPAATQTPASSGPSFLAGRRAEPPTRPTGGATVSERPADDQAPARSPQRPAASPRAVPSRTAPALDDPDDPDLGAAPDDWNTFWPWARERGFANLQAVEARIGKSVRGMTPRELYNLIQTFDEE